MNVGFIGLGTMGTPMVLNLLKHGHTVTVHSARLNSENVKLAVSHGAVVAESPRSVARDSEAVMLSLPNAEASERVVLGRDGVLQGAAAGTVIVEMSTVPPSCVIKIARAAKSKAVEFLDAPVSGGRVGAELGALTVMVGGERKTFERCLPLFESVGKSIYHVGGLGAGETIKLINTLLADANLLAAREALELASKTGLDLNLLQKIISSSTGQSWMWNNWVPAILDRKTVGASYDVVLKDFRYILEMAARLEVDAKTGTDTARKFSQWRRRKGGAADVSSAFEFLERGRSRAKRWRLG